MHTLTSLRLLCAAGALALAMNAQADSSTSSASSAGSASSGSISDSIGSSSNSSTGGDKVADGAYRIIDIAAAPNRAGMVRVTMQAETASFTLTLPRHTFDQQQLAQGDLVYAKNREYGIEFARNDTRVAFYLALADEWHGEMASRPVTL